MEEEFNSSDSGSGSSSCPPEAEPGPELSSSLSDEILLMIVSHLDLVDIINLSQTCHKFDNLLKDRTICGKLKLPWHSKLKRLTFVMFLRNGQRASVITKLNLNDLYWVPSGVIRDIARPLIHLQELHVAGTSLSWTHLCEILVPSEKLHSLSWSWDHRLEHCNKNLGSGSNPASSSVSPQKRFNLLSPNYSLANMGDMSSIASSLQRLKFLLLHIPTVHNFSAPTYPAHSGMSHLISKCENIEHLWIFAWPKTNEETKLMEIFGEDNFPENFILTKLKTFTVRVMSFPRLYAPKLINTVITSVGVANEEDPFQLEHLWLDHPLLSGSPWNRIVFNRFRGTAESFLHPWPKLNLNSVKRFSLPLMEGAAEWLTSRNTFDNINHLQITDGLARIVNLNGVFDSAQNLETFVLKKAFNYKLDWNRFVETHLRLKEVSVCEDGYFPYPEICVALSSLKDLRKLSLPLYALLEILDAVIIDKHRATLDIDDVYFDEKDSSDSSSLNDVSLSASLFRSKRVSRVGATPTNTKASHFAVSGLDLVTQNCSRVNEFELGFSTQTRPGSIVLKSLSTISKWKQLTKLSIDGAPVLDGKFLIEIAKCCKLQSLRLKDLGSRAKCIYINELYVALQHMQYLEDFRFEQNYIGSTAKLFSSLSNCIRLRRFLLWAKANDQPLDPPSCLNLINTCQDLMMLYLTVGATTKYVCETTRKKIESTHKHNRPGLSVIIRRGGLGIHEDALAPAIYPSVHYRDMVVFAPQIGQQNHFNVH